mmetsp:Transcript_4526/g.9783  ORF Transcript_4526/g.9783 Transcript_4526/m.9783 type:complete len:213 (-) Transcript_4526:106-744(-)
MCTQNRSTTRRVHAQNDWPKYCPNNCSTVPDKRNIHSASDVLTDTRRHPLPNQAKTATAAQSPWPSLSSSSLYATSELRAVSAVTEVAALHVGAPGGPSASTFFPTSTPPFDWCTSAGTSLAPPCAFCSFAPVAATDASSPSPGRFFWRNEGSDGFGLVRGDIRAGGVTRCSGNATGGGSATLSEARASWNSCNSLFRASSRNLAFTSSACN